MSAFDITGAIWWPVIGVVFIWAGWFGLRDDGGNRDAASCFLFGICLFLPATFCIARLFGAHI